MGNIFGDLLFEIDYYVSINSSEVYYIKNTTSSQLCKKQFTP